MSRYDDHTEDQERDHAPRHGHPDIRPRRKRRWPWVLLVIGALFVVLGIVASSGTTQQTSTGSGTLEPVVPDAADNAAAPPPVTEQDAEATLAYGATYDADGLQVTAAAPKAGSATLGATYCAQVSYVNGRDEAVPFGIFDWKLVDTEGVESTATFTGTRDPNAGLGQGSLRPAGKKTGTVCWDKQGTGTPAQIIYQGGLFGSPVVWAKPA